MKIYTGYYGNMRAYSGMQCVGISVGTPRWLKAPLPNCRQLNPEYRMLKLEREPYTEAYNALLATLDPETILAYLRRVSGGKDVVLLCYERPDDFCHRQLVAEWLRAKTGIEVKEYFAPLLHKQPVSSPEPESEQMELF